MADERLPHVAEDDDLAHARRLWNKYGTSITTTIIIGLSLIVGLNFWQGYEQKQRVSASDAYSNFLSVDNLPDAIAYDALLNESGSTETYGQLYAFSMADRYVAIDDTTRAQEQLQGILEKSEAGPIAHIARLRLAAIYLDQAQPQRALDLLTVAESSEESFASRYYELIADAYALRANEGDQMLAQESYQLSLQTNANFANRELIQLKIDKLGGI